MVYRLLGIYAITGDNKQQMLNYYRQCITTVCQKLNDFVNFDEHTAVCVCVCVIYHPIDPPPHVYPHSIFLHDSACPAPSPPHQIKAHTLLVPNHPSPPSLSLPPPALALPINLSTLQRREQLMRGGGSVTDFWRP